MIQITCLCLNKLLIYHVCHFSSQIINFVKLEMNCEPKKSQLLVWIEIIIFPAIDFEFIFNFDSFYYDWGVSIKYVFRPAMSHFPVGVA